MNVENSKKKPIQLDLPALDDDRAERKRVLNVLAQRRYRRRKKEEIQDLEREVRRNKRTPRPAGGTPKSTTLCQPGDVSLAVASDTHEWAPSLESTDFIIDPNNTYPDHYQAACFDSMLLNMSNMNPAFSLPSLTSSPSPVSSSDSWRQSNGLPHPDFPIFDEVFDFPDETHLPMLELNLLRGAMSVAQRLNVDSVIWSLDANSPFHNSSPELYVHLPPNLQPTPLQLAKAHHPVLDILPWPSVRERLIMVFAQPMALRPPAAKSPTALVDLVYDLEDSAEGIRIWGDDPYLDHNWEVGKKFFSNWWWALDSQVVNRSNQLRKERGATLLGADQGRDIEEIE